MSVTDAELLERYPWGAIDHDNKEQWRGFLDHELRIFHCLDCGHWYDPPRDMCPKCWSLNVQPEPVSGRGRVQWFTMLHQGAPGASPEHPFPVAVIELEEQENLRVDATIIDFEPGEIACDLPVELAWVGTDEAPTPAFRLRHDA